MIEYDILDLKESLDAETIKKFRKFLKKFKTFQDATLEKVSAVLLENLDENGAIVLSDTLSVRIREICAEQGKQLVTDEREFVRGLLEDVYSDAATKNAKVIGFKPDFSLVRQEMIDRAVKAPIDGKSFSARIWKNTNALAQRIHNDVVDMVREGKRPNEISRQIKKDFGSSAYEAERLVRTESAKVQSEAQKDVYESSGVVSSVQWCATLENSTCDECGAMDGKIYSLHDAPNLPFHPNCKCCLLPVIDGYESRTRADNETHKTIDYIDWQNWKKQQ